MIDLLLDAATILCTAFMLMLGVVGIFFLLALADRFITTIEEWRDGR